MMKSLRMDGLQLPVWIVVGLLCFDSKLFIREVAAEVTTACAGTVGIPCTAHSFSCSETSSIFPVKAEYGYKDQQRNCQTQVANCVNMSCCNEHDDDCYKPYNDVDFAGLYAKCWNKSENCTYDVGTFQGGRALCNKTIFEEYPNFSRVQHVCMKDDHIMDILENRTVDGSIFAIRYDSSQNYTDGFWQCRVILDVNRSDTVKVLVVKEQSMGSTTTCSMLGINGIPIFNCTSANVSYHYFEDSKTFNITLYKSTTDNFRLGWIVVQASNGKVNVTCGEYLGDEPDFVTGTPSSTDTTEYTTVAQTTTPSLATSTYSGTPNTTISNDSVVAPSRNAGAIAGGVMAAIAVLALVVIRIVCFIRRRRQKQQEAKPPKTGASIGRFPLTSLQSSSSSGPCPAQPGTAGTRNHVTPDFPAKSRDYFVVEPQASANGHVTEASETDYNRLGQKKSQRSSSNPAGAYGRLGEVGGGGDVTDYNYDHLAKGRQAAPNVINSDYDTAALHVTSEGDYNVAGIPKKQHVITGSDYDVAQIVTSEGDYNRVDFQEKKQRVITGSDYDSAEIVTSDGDYNRVDFQGRKQKVVTGSDYDSAEILTSDGDYNRVDFQGKQQKVVTGSDYDMATLVTPDTT